MSKKIILILSMVALGCLQMLAQDHIAIKHGPYLQNLEEDEVTIVWVASKPSIGWVELAADGEDNFYVKEREKFFDSSDGIKNISTVHAVRITNLKRGTKYRYRIFAKEVLKWEYPEVFYGKTASTVIWQNGPLTFTTLDATKPTVSFAHYSDIHEHAADIPKLFNLAGGKKLDLVIYNGDMSSTAKDEETFFRGFMDTTVVTFGKEIPMYYARGNHETRSYYSSHFHEYFSPKNPHLYYTFRQGPVFFVVLDSGEDKPDSDIEYGGLADYDRYRSEQALWLKEVLESKEYQEAPVKIVVSHVPMAVTAENWHAEQELLDKFVPLLNQHKPDLVMSGHWHRYKFFESNSVIHFPVIVNSNNTVIKTDVDRSAIKMVVYDTDGKIVDKKTISVP